MNIYENKASQVDDRLQLLGLAQATSPMGWVKPGPQQASELPQTVPSDVKPLAPAVASPEDPLSAQGSDVKETLKEEQPAPR